MKFRKISEAMLLADTGRLLEAEKILQELSLVALESREENVHLLKLLYFLSNRYQVALDELQEGRFLQVHDSAENSLQSEAMSIFVVTPTFNSASTIEQTIRSVVNQRGNFNLRYHIQDGGSSDDTIRIVKKWEEIVRKYPRYRHVRLTHRSERDSGMYDAISSAFLEILPTHDVWMGWINSDDTLMPDVLKFLVDTTSVYGDQVKWVTGMQAVKHINGNISMHNLNFPAEVIAAGLCDGQFWWFMQQEGTFWRKSLWDKIDLEADFRRFRLAGDWNLWFRFASLGATLHQARMPLGIFHQRDGQLSQASFEEYMAEINSVCTIESRKTSLATLKDQMLQVHFLERFFNFDAIVMSSAFTRLTGAKACYPTVQPVRLIN